MDTIRSPWGISSMVFQCLCPRALEQPTADIAAVPIHVCSTADAAL